MSSFAAASFFSFAEKYGMIAVTVRSAIAKYERRERRQGVSPFGALAKAVVAIYVAAIASGRRRSAGCKPNLTSK